MSDIGEKVRTTENRRMNPMGLLTAAFTVSIALSTGCAVVAKQKLETQVKDLEREIVRLKAEKVNWDAHGNALDDQMVILKKRLDRCYGGEEPGLKVVKLRPTEEDDGESFEGITPDAEIAPFNPNRRASRSSSSRRQVLVLRGKPQNYRSPTGIQGGTAEVNLGSEGMSSQSFSHLEPENLGVVKQEKGIKKANIDDFNAAYRAYSNRKYGEALRLFSKFIYENPSDKLADNAIFWRGECFLAQGQFFKAIGEFERLPRRYPKSDKLPSSLCRIGFAWDKLGDQTKAMEYYFLVVNNHTGSEAARRASRRVAHINAEGKRAGNIVRTAQKR